MIVATAVRLLLVSAGALVGALLLQALIGTPASAVVILLVLASAAVRLALVVSQWHASTYAMSHDGLSFRSGRLSTSERFIAYDAVHSVDVEEPWLWKAFGRVVLRLRHGAHGTDAITFDALRRSEADRILARVDRADAHVSSSARSVELDQLVDERTSAVRHAAARAHPWLAIPIAMAVLGLLAQLEQRTLFEMLGLALTAFAGATPLLQALALAAGLAVGWCASVLWRLIATANHSAAVSPSDVETRAGLLTVTSRALSRRDLSVAEVRQPLLHRAADRAMLFLSTGAGRGEPALQVALDAPLASALHFVARCTAHASRPGPVVAASRRAATVCKAALAAVVTVLVGTAASIAARPVGFALAILVGTIVVAVIASRHAQLSVHSRSGRCDLRRGVLTRRHWIFDAEAVLHVEVVVGMLGDVLPTSRVRIVVADRGARVLSVPGLTSREARAAGATIVGHPRFGRYRHRRA